jgi:3-oxoacyl-[acyl-carrier protein] reductase
MVAGTLADRVVLVTGVSRRRGIGFGIAERLLADGAKLVVHSWPVHDAEQPWGADCAGIDGVIAELGGIGPRLRHLEADFEDPEAPSRVVEYTVGEFGGIDAVVANHARSSPGTLMGLTVDQLDAAWAVNARAVVLLVKAFAAARRARLTGGRVVLFTSGQHIAPMPDELPYAISKGAVHQMTRSLADALAESGVTVNAINPGPIDTGWPSPELRERLRSAFPAARWGRPEDIAAIVTWLVSDESAWITGQVIDAEGGFRRSKAD